jgi:hypothetical protein
MSTAKRMSVKNKRKRKVQRATAFVHLFGFKIVKRRLVENFGLIRKSKRILDLG